MTITFACIDDPGFHLLATANVIAFFMGLIPAAIASNKGRDFFTWWTYGWLLWIIALIHSLCLRDEYEALPARVIPNYAIAPSPPPQEPVRSPLTNETYISEVLARWRRCPHCAEVIRAQAVVCYKCHRDIGVTK